MPGRTVGAIALAGWILGCVAEEDHPRDEGKGDDCWETNTSTAAAAPLGAAESTDQDRNDDILGASVSGTPRYWFRHVIDEDSTALDPLAILKAGDVEICLTYGCDDAETHIECADGQAGGAGTWCCGRGENARIEFADLHCGSAFYWGSDSGFLWLRARRTGDGDQCVPFLAWFHP